MPWEDDPVEVPRAPHIDAKHNQTGGVGEEAGKQRHPHHLVQLGAVKDPGGDANGETAGANARQDHHVKGFP